MEAHHIMQRDVAVLEPEASLRDASALMHENDVRHIPILEHGQVVGIISDRDLRCYLSDLFTYQPESTPASARKTITVRQIMQAKPISVDPDSDLDEVIECMLEFKIGAVVVVDSQGLLKGIISYEDILRAVRDSLASLPTALD
jgi:acetoin utilization protein AcuB